MADPTLPDDLPGLLRCGTVVRDAADPDRIGVVVGTGSSLGCRVLWVMSEELTWTSEVPVLLDLTDPTGRVHAAWWLEGMIQAEASRTLLGNELAKYELSRAGLLDALLLASRGADMRYFEINHLRTACLRAAGRTDAT